ncbi:hypothetical protein LV89_04960 [Arcicella aurantiaca]|uniref:Uncharacterized protein n=1 Tax=Arcicella aurantiaca TaxID=591202 RepID=A0A316DZ27_9BACT|nr:hypothetical protein LV89_04960 [Arcicella aurantiaca]
MSIFTMNNDLYHHCIYLVFWKKRYVELPYFGGKRINNELIFWTIKKVRLTLLLNLN